MTGGAQCLVILDFKKEIYCTFEDLHYCLSATLIKMGQSKETVQLKECWHITWHKNVLVLLYWYYLMSFGNPCLPIPINLHPGQQPCWSQAKHTGRVSLTHLRKAEKEKGSFSSIAFNILLPKILNLFIYLELVTDTWVFSLFVHTIIFNSQSCWLLTHDHREERHTSSGCPLTCLYSSDKVGPNERITNFWQLRKSQRENNLSFIRNGISLFWKTGKIFLKKWSLD